MPDDIDRSHHDHEHSPAGPHVLPPPPIPKDAKLPPGFDWFPLYYRTLIQSDFWQSNQEEPEIIVAAIALWMAAMQQNPVGSLPTYRPSLMSLSGTYAITQRLQPINRYIEYLTDNGIGGESVKTLSDTLSAALPDAERTLDGALWGFEEHSDGRLYHPTITKVVLDQLKKSDKHRTGANLTNQKKQEEQEDEPIKRPSNTKRSAKRGGERNAKRGAERGDIDTDKDKERKSPLTPSGGTRAEPSLRSEAEASLYRDTSLSPPPSAEPRGSSERGSATTNLADGQTSPPEASPRGRAKEEIDPEARVSREGIYDDARVQAICGLSHKQLVDKLHNACVGSSRLIHGSVKLERADAIVDLLEANTAVSLELDVLPAIRDRVKRPGDCIGSWAFFCDAILGAHQNRTSGAGSPSLTAGRYLLGPYDAGNLPKWWRDWDKGAPPPGHPWQKRVLNEQTQELRCNGGHWDWQWFDRVAKYERTGEWDYSFNEKLPGRPGSCCPDDILAHFGIKPQVRQEGAPIIDMRVAREVAAQRAREGRTAMPRPPEEPEGGGFAKAVGGLPTGVAGQVDDIPPKARAAVASAIANAVEIRPDAYGFYRMPDDDAPPF